MNKLEIWKDMKGWEGLYQISNIGRVRSLDREVTSGFGSVRMSRGQMIIPNVKKGYDTVGLCRNGSREWFLVHRLVALTFIPNPNNYPVVHHIDENKSNNHITNLEWCTYHYNNTYGDRLVGWGDKVRVKLSKAVLQYTMDGEFVKRWDAMIDAEREGGFRQGNISNCCRGTAKSHKGFIWKLEGDTNVE